MNRNRIISLVVAVTVTIIIIYSFSGGQSPEEYKEYIAEEREERDRFMRSSESPFKPVSSFKGLNYYPANLDYKINARFTKAEEVKIVALGTNDGKIKEYLTYGTASFEFQGKENSLLILENAEDGSLFLAFGDETSAIETYGAGRYLDVKHSGGNSILLDFNLAYNPFCAYTEEYSCPLPPIENLLKIPITAGEKDY